MNRTVLLLVLLFASINLNAQYSDTIKLNDIRILASHNSYKKVPSPAVLEVLTKHKERLGEANDPKQIEYGHEDLIQQLDKYEIRGFELDVNYDPKGGRYYKRRINGFAKGLKKRSKIPELEEPGFKIIHITDVDYETNYLTLKSALIELDLWSALHPRHIPLFVNIEAKGAGIGDYSKLAKFLGFKTAVQFDSTAFSLLDQEIYRCIDSSRVFTPKALKAGYNSINQRLDAEGWPELNECLGKIFFIMQGNNKDMYTAFLDDGQDRPMFVYGQPEEPSTAFVVRNQPIGNVEEIHALTEKYIVRTRSDAGTLEARANDSSRWLDAIRSQAQIISTDYYKSNPDFSPFFVSMPYELTLRNMPELLK
ncbi:MAG: hypothetical protein HRT57_00190 [Crocinitomicaceae bacterium]|nr:hypothetical protein [Crocinitomicaceae bacterium]